jgi:hypothetical protein
MRIVDLAEFGKGNRKAGNWSRVSDVRDDGVRRVIIFHYSTPMLKYIERSHDVLISSVDFRLGHGSVSDQQGMNTLFKALGLPYYYSRKGGAQIG